MKLTLRDWLACRAYCLPIIARWATINHHNFTEQIDEALSHERAFLFVGTAGFVVLEPLALTQGVSLNVMFAYGEQAHAIAGYQADIEALAQAIGAQQLEMCTTVRSLATHLLAQGWQCQSRAGPIEHWVKPIGGGDSHGRSENPKSARDRSTASGD